MKHSGLEGAYEAARTWTLHSLSHPPPGWAQIVRRGVARWMQEMHPARPWHTISSEPVCLGLSPLLTIVAAMIAEVCS